MATATVKEEDLVKSGPSRTERAASGAAKLGKQGVGAAQSRSVEGNYRKFVVIALLGSALIIAADRSFRGSFPKPRVFVALLFVWIMLAFMAEFAPKLAAYFAGLIFTAILLTNGPYVFQQINKRISAGNPPTKGKGK